MVPGYSPYEASNVGRIRRGTRILAGCLDSDGYRRINTCILGRRRLVPVHTLVALAFIGPRPTDREAAHWNGRKQDNRPQNLRWATHKEQYSDRVRHGSGIACDRHPRRKLSSADAAQIRRLYVPRIVTLKDIAERYGVCLQAIHRIVSGKGWLF